MSDNDYLLAMLWVAFVIAGVCGGAVLADTNRDFLSRIVLFGGALIWMFGIIYPQIKALGGVAL